MTIGQLDPPCCGIERSEEHVLGEHISAGKLVEQGRFSGVGVADDGCVCGSEFFAFFALGLALAADIFELTFESIDALVSQATVHLNLFFTHATVRAAAATTAAARTATFAVKVSPHAGHARQGVLHACEVNLNARFTGLCAFVKNIEDHFFSVDHCYIAQSFP